MAKFVPMEVVLLNKMGTDLDIANAARVTLANHHEVMTIGDVKLLNYLAENGHWSPFSHVSMQFRIKAPIYIARQLAKHQVGASWNEMSRRYVSKEPEFFRQYMWNAQEGVKQGSGGDIIEGMDILLENNTEDALRAYKCLLREGVAPEAARAVLPQNMMTEWIWTGSVYFFSRVVKLRNHPHAQKEARWIAENIQRYMEKHFPYAAEALKREGK